jgi:hypothetical protein
VAAVAAGDVESIALAAVGNAAIKIRVRQIRAVRRMKEPPDVVAFAADNCTGRK